MTLHLEDFRNGGSFLLPARHYWSFVAGRDVLGDPSGQFITTRAGMDWLLASCGNGLHHLERSLGIPASTWNEPIYRVDVHHPLRYRARLPSGAERGANAHFRRGGYTSGGLPEIVTDPFPVADTTITDTGIRPCSSPGENPMTAATIPCPSCHESTPAHEYLAHKAAYVPALRRLTCVCRACGEVAELQVDAGAIWLGYMVAAGAVQFSAMREVPLEGLSVKHHPRSVELRLGERTWTVAERGPH
ncbi:hypothetical protein [Chondromyces crocatus]|uniref:hypothetical protein n=1 Tax=Chondromyces crocatus TaxID=52 RepID=UPI0012E15BE8|nr:hypothetical protein [Chondromyces crocatus]